MKYVENLYELYKIIYQEVGYTIPYDVFEIIFKELEQAPSSGIFNSLDPNDAVGLIVQTKIMMNEYATAILKDCDNDHDKAYTKYIGKK